VRVNPDNRCAIMLAYGMKLVVLPFKKDTSFDEFETQNVKPIKKAVTQLVARTPILSFYMITLKDLDEKIDNVLDIQFLHGYYEPTLLIYTSRCVRFLDVWLADGTLAQWWLFVEHPTAGASDHLDRDQFAV
jgi:hypothetical protein